MVELVRHSPLETFAPAFEAVRPDIRLQELPFRTMVDVRAPADLVDLEPYDVLRLGPDWFLVVDELRPAENLVTELTPRCGSVVDVSAWRTIVELRGPQVRDLLETGCSIDLHPGAFPVGGYAQTLLARAPVIVQCLELDAYRVFVRASYASYVATWLLDAVDGLED